MSHAELLARHRKVLPSWLALYYDQPIELVDGKGCRVVDGEGASYLDFFAGILTTIIGYTRPRWWRPSGSRRAGSSTPRPCT